VPGGGWPASIRVNLAAVLINANQDDEAYGLLTTARSPCSVGVRNHPLVLPMRALAPLRAPCILA
jgi:hypothetical protein